MEHPAVSAFLKVRAATYQFETIERLMESGEGEHRT